MPPAGTEPQGRERIRQRPPLELLVKSYDDPPQLTASTRRQGNQHRFHGVPTGQRIVARAVRERHIQPAPRTSKELLALVEGLAQTTWIELVGFQAPDSSLGTTPESRDLTEPPGITAAQPPMGAQRAGRPTRHRPFGSESRRHHATRQIPSTPRNARGGCNRRAGAATAAGKGPVERGVDLPVLEIPRSRHARRSRRP